MLFKIFGIERAWQQYCDTTENLVPRPRQVFVTQSAFLARKVQEAYTKLSHMLAMEHGHHALKPHAEEERALVDMDEEAHWHSTLPRAFSQLDESHFPLFVTYSMLCEMLEQDFKSAKASHNHTSPIADRLEARTMSSQQLKKQFDPAQIFAEFMGVIKGSERALRTQQGYLTREEYTPTQRRSGVLSVDRDTIYDLFEAYLKVKRRRGEYDAADRTYRIFCGLRRDGIPGRKVDYVYVDEVQDNLLTDTFILRSICRNPNGLFWAGDTAQTISAGSSFKFNELKAFQWRLEANAQKQCLPAKNPRLFQLVKNYRSHGGIVKCAQSILDLLMHFWPDSIDHIADETDSIPGPTPIFFPGGFTKGSAGLGEFLLTSSADARSETGVELGAQGCILVRDDTAREQLRSEVGDTGIIIDFVIQWFWQQKGLIRIHKIGDKIPRLATTSTAEEWSEIAHELFQRKQYEEAAKSFGRAGRLSQKAQAIAFHLRQTAELKPHPAAGRGTAKSSRSLAFLSAAEAFSACAVAGSAFPSTSRSYHRNAAECYANSGDDARAGDEFQSASEYTMAAQYYRRAGLFDKAIHILRVHRDAIPPDIADGIKEVAKMHYVSKHELKKAMTLFESEDKAIYFMEEMGRIQLRASELNNALLTISGDVDHWA
ncbi:hypothetical protein EUX98_g4867 [Antrodiella citrinella]|uniref:UvrD-like helicase ATP-binding domain-containing protein n=1 Tax=Antrodiella citrinella TaxID=2447956 RepID=A0A4S4MSZ3_9APHY|nr:hypothetical protein EUX98_g4867 [Antrodiella citrinella]